MLSSGASTETSVIRVASQRVSHLPITQTTDQ